MTWDRIGKRDRQKEQSVIQDYINAMGVDLKPDYFLNLENSHLNQQQRSILEERERNTNSLEQPEKNSTYKGLSKRLSSLSHPIKDSIKEEFKNDSVQSIAAPKIPVQSIKSNTYTPQKTEKIPLGIMAKHSNGR